MPLRVKTWFVFTNTENENRKPGLCLRIPNTEETEK